MEHKKAVMVDEKPVIIYSNLLSSFIKFIDIAEEVNYYEDREGFEALFSDFSFHTRRILAKLKLIKAIYKSIKKDKDSNRYIIENLKNINIILNLYTDETVETKVDNRFKSFANKSGMTIVYYINERLSKKVYLDFYGNNIEYFLECNDKVYRFGHNENRNETIYYNEDKEVREIIFKYLYLLVNKINKDIEDCIVFKF